MESFLGLARAADAVQHGARLPSEVDIRGVEEAQRLLIHPRGTARTAPSPPPVLLPFPCGAFSFRPHAPLVLRTTEQVSALSLSGLFGGRYPGAASLAAFQARCGELLLLGHLLRGTGGAPSPRDASFKSSVYRRVVALKLPSGGGAALPSLLGCSSDARAAAAAVPGVGSLFMLGEWRRGLACGGVSAALVQAAAPSSPPDAAACAAALSSRLHLGLLDFPPRAASAQLLAPQQQQQQQQQWSAAAAASGGAGVAFPLAALQPCGPPSAPAGDGGVGGGATPARCAYLTVPAVPDLVAMGTACTLVACVFLPRGWELDENGEGSHSAGCIVASPRWGLGIDAGGCLVGWLRPDPPLLSPVPPAASPPVVSPLPAWWGEGGADAPPCLRSPRPLPRGRWVEVALSVDPARGRAVLAVDGLLVASSEGEAPAALPACAPPAAPQAALPLVIGADIQYAFALPAAAVGAAVDAVAGSTRAPPAAFAAALAELEARVAAAEDAPGGLHDVAADLGAFAAVPSRALAGLVRDVVLAAGALSLPETSTATSLAQGDVGVTADASGLTVVGHWPCRGAEGVTADVSGGGRGAVLRTSAGGPRVRGADAAAPGSPGEVLQGSAPFLGHALGGDGDSSLGTEGAQARPPPPLLLLRSLGVLSADRAVLPVLAATAAAEGTPPPPPPPPLVLFGSVSCTGAGASDPRCAAALGAAVDATPRPLSTDFHTLVSVRLAPSGSGSGATAAGAGRGGGACIRLGLHGTAEAWRLSCADLYGTPAALQGGGCGEGSAAADWVAAAVRESSGGEPASAAGAQAESGGSAAGPDASAAARESAEAEAFERERAELEAWISQLRAGRAAGPPPSQQPVPEGPSSASPLQRLLPPWPQPPVSPLAPQPASQPLPPLEDAARRCPSLVTVQVEEVAAAAAAGGGPWHQFLVTVARLSAQTACQAVARSAGSLRQAATGAAAAAAAAAAGASGGAAALPVLGKRERDVSGLSDAASEQSPPGGGATFSAHLRSIGAVVGQGSVWLRVEPDGGGLDSSATTDLQIEVQYSHAVSLLSVSLNGSLALRASVDLHEVLGLEDTSGLGLVSVAAVRGAAGGRGGSAGWNPPVLSLPVIDDVALLHSLSPGSSLLRAAAPASCSLLRWVFLASRSFCDAAAASGAALADPLQAFSVGSVASSRSGADSSDSMQVSSSNAAHALLATAGGEVAAGPASDAAAAAAAAAARFDGNLPCPTCTFANPPQSTKCEVCEAELSPLPPLQPSTAAAGNANASASASSGASAGGDALPWLCSCCGYLMPSADKECRERKTQQTLAGVPVDRMTADELSSLLLGPRHTLRSIAAPRRLKDSMESERIAKAVFARVYPSLHLEGKAGEKTPPSAAYGRATNGNSILYNNPMHHSNKRRQANAGLSEFAQTPMQAFESDDDMPPLMKDQGPLFQGNGGAAAANLAHAIAPAPQAGPASFGPEWPCPACTFINEGSAVVCGVCDTAKNKGVGLGGARINTAMALAALSSPPAGDPLSPPPVAPVQLYAAVHLLTREACAAAAAAAEGAGGPFLELSTPVASVELTGAWRTSLQAGGLLAVGVGAEGDASVPVAPLRTPVPGDLDFGFLLRGRYGHGLPLRPPPHAAGGVHAAVASAGSKVWGGGDAAPVVERGVVELLALLSVPAELAGAPPSTDAPPRAGTGAWRVFGTSTALSYAVGRALLPVQEDGAGAAKGAPSLAALLCPVRSAVGASQCVTGALDVPGSALSLHVHEAPGGGKTVRTIGNRLEHAALLPPLSDGASDSRGGGAAAPASELAGQQLELSRGYAGLVNSASGLTNVCYQNSLLQSLFMTEELRRRLLAMPLRPLLLQHQPEDSGGEVMSSTSLVPAGAKHDVRVLGWGDFLPLAAAADSSGFVFSHPLDDELGLRIEDQPPPPPLLDAPPASPPSSELAVATAVTNRLQWLFARLEFSLRAAHGSHALQAVLPPNYARGDQHDVTEWQHWLSERVDLAVTKPAPGGAPDGGAPALGPFEATFGGSLATVRVCVGKRAVPAEVSVAAVGASAEAPMAEGSAPASTPSRAPPLLTTCGEVSMTIDPTSSLTAQLPRGKRAPITGIIVILARRELARPLAVTVPQGYELVDGGDICPGREGDVAAFLAVTRERKPLVYGPSGDLQGAVVRTPITGLSLNIRANRYTAVNRAALAQQVPATGRVNVRVDLYDDAYLAYCTSHEEHVADTDLNFCGQSAERVFLAADRRPYSPPITDVCIIDPANDVVPPGYERVGVGSAGMLPLYVARVQWLRDLQVHSQAPQQPAYFAPLPWTPPMAGHLSFEVAARDLPLDATARLLETIVTGAASRSGGILLPPLPSALVWTTNFADGRQRPPITDILLVPASSTAAGVPPPPPLPRLIPGSTPLAGFADAASSAGIAPAPPSAVAAPADTPLARALRDGYELAAVPTNALLLGHHLLVRRGEGFPLTHFAAHDRGSGPPQNEAWEALTVRPPPTATPRLPLQRQLAGVWEGADSTREHSLRSLVVTSATPATVVVVNGRLGAAPFSGLAFKIGVDAPSAAAPAPGAPSWPGVWQLIGSCRPAEPPGALWGQVQLKFSVQPSRVSVCGSFVLNGTHVTVTGSHRDDSGGASAGAAPAAFNGLGPIVELVLVSEAEAAALGPGWEVLRSSKPKPTPPPPPARAPSSGGAAAGAANAGAGAGAHWPDVAVSAAAALAAYDPPLPALVAHTADLRGARSASDALPGPQQQSDAGGGLSESKTPCGGSGGAAVDAPAAAFGAAATSTSVPPLYLAARRQPRTHLEQGAPGQQQAQAGADTDPIVDVMVVSRAASDAGKPWGELLPPGYVALDKALGGGGGKEAFIATLRRSGWLAAACAAGAAVPPPPPVLVDLDVLWLDDGARDEPLPGFRVVERTAQTLLAPAQAAALPWPVNGTARVEPATLSGAAFAGGGERPPHAVALAVRFDAAPPVPLADCPLSGAFACTSPEGDAVPQLELAAVHAGPGAVIWAVLGASATSALPAIAAAAQWKAAGGASGGAIPPALLEDAPDLEFFRSVNESRLLGVAAPASAAALLASVASGSHLTRSMHDTLSLAPPVGAAAVAAEPAYVMGVWKGPASAATDLGGGSGVEDLLPQVFHAVWDADGVSANGAFNVGPPSAAIGSAAAPAASYPWRLHARHVLHLAWKRDVYTLFRRNQLVSTDVVPGAFSVPALLRHQFLPQLLTLDNRSDCRRCGSRAERIAASAVVEAPRHLTVQLARMNYSAALGRSIKRLSQVLLEPTLVLPTADANVLALVAATRQLAQLQPQQSQPPLLPFVTPATQGNSARPTAPTSAAPPAPPSNVLAPAVAYGLYAVVVHAGEFATSGHYFSFARRSDAPGADLSRTDCPEAPWLKFNDLSVAPVRWDAWTRELACSLSETPYVLFYRRLEGAPAAETLRQWRERSPASAVSALDAAGISAAGAVAEVVASVSAAAAAAAEAAVHAQQRADTPVTRATAALIDLGLEQQQQQQQQQQQLLQQQLLQQQCSQGPPPSQPADDSVTAAAAAAPEPELPQQLQELQGVAAAAGSVEESCSPGSGASDAPLLPAWAARILQDNVRCALAPALTRFSAHYVALEARAAAVALPAAPAPVSPPSQPGAVAAAGVLGDAAAAEASQEDAVMYSRAAMGDLYRAASAGRDTV